MRDVAVAYLRFDEVTGNFLDSFSDLLAYEFQGPNNIGDALRLHVQSLGVVDGANGIEQTFLKGDLEWLFWLDCDMGFAPNVLDQLRRAADPVDRPAVSALTFKYQQTHLDGFNGYLAEERPVIMDWLDDDEGRPTLACRRTYPENSLVRCDSVGMACVLIHRSVIQGIFDKFGPVWHTPIHFGEGAPTTGEMEASSAVPTKTLGPDVSFWARASSCGFPLYVHTGVGTNHQKSTWLSPNSYAARHGTEMHDVTDLTKVGEVSGNLVAAARPSNRAARRRASRVKA